MDNDARVKVSEEGGYRSLLAHAGERARAARARFGPDIDLARMQEMLADTAVVRYPTRLEFGTEGIGPGMFAVVQGCGAAPADGFVLRVHPHFRGREEELPLLIAYHLVAINYGEIADREVAERFGAALLGLEVEDYYARLCALADELEAGDAEQH